MYKLFSLVVLVFLMSVAHGCGGASMDSLVNTLETELQNMKQAADSGDEEAFLSAGSAMADTMLRMKPLMEKADAAEKEKYGKKIMSSIKVMMDPQVMTMVLKIQSGSNAGKWEAIEKKMESLRN